MDCLARDQGLLNKIQSAIGHIKQVKAKGARSRDGSSGQKACESSLYFVQDDILEIKVTHVEHLTSTAAIV